MLRQKISDIKTQIYLSKRANVRTSAFVQIIQELPEVVDVVASALVSDEVAAVGDSGPNDEDAEFSPTVGESGLTSASPLTENIGIRRSTRNTALLSILRYYISFRNSHKFYS